MNNNSIYIPPAIKFYSSFDEALSADPEWDQSFSFKEEKWEFKDLFTIPKTFIVAEPGYLEFRYKDRKKVIFFRKNCISVIFLLFFMLPREGV